MKKQILIILSLTLILFAGVAEVFGIPAFARKYRMTCKTCHSPFPKLTEYGEEFAANGFELTDKKAPRYYVETGDDELSLIRDFPIAMRLEGYLTVNNKNQEQLDFTAPYLVKLLSGGQITSGVSYYLYFFMSERGEVAGLEDAFVMFNNLFGAELDIYVGQFQVSDPLFKRELRLSYEDYSIYGATPGDSSINLKYDRGIMVTYDLPIGTGIVFEILNGTGIHEANIFRNFDNDEYKNYMIRVSQSIGEFLSIGGFYYSGKEEKEGQLNEAWIAGGDATLSAGPFELSFQYVEREDDNPYFLAQPLDAIATKGIIGELVFRPQGDDSTWYGVGLYNWVESDEIGLNYESGALHVGYLLRRNIRLVCEYTHVFDSINSDYDRFGAGLVMAF